MIRYNFVNVKSMKVSVPAVAAIMLVGMLATLSGCVGGIGEYTNGGLHPDDVVSVYVEMFDSSSFRRQHEVVLTDAICKRIESETPYKIISDRNRADTVLSGNISSIGSGVLATDRNTGGTLEREATVNVVVNWKNLKTGELLVDNKTAIGMASYSSELGQDFDYAARVAVNNAAVRVVELMEKPW